jgi:hypothetical protein
MMWDKVQTTGVKFGMKLEKKPFPFFDHIIEEEDEDYGEEEVEEYY